MSNDEDDYWFNYGFEQAEEKAREEGKPSVAKFLIEGIEQERVENMFKEMKGEKKDTTIADTTKALFGK